MFEGHDTIKSSLLFTLYCISRNADVQSKPYAEIVVTLGTNMQQALPQRPLMQLKYTEQVIKDTLRVYPSAPYIGRIYKIFILMSITYLKALAWYWQFMKCKMMPNTFRSHTGFYQNVRFSLCFCVI
ncbi:PREDICTED: cytochrome P450 4d8-like [Bactrocera latifrons]|uniref:Cytochrome P450 4d8 n=1 Tax=Bactrocera latifrons TaxID=174628 RepID=A0A0K8U2P4_BACLA|nr:PREDICTED: cytochrome P450 4d8-like [Bactrocera latifrons]